MTPEERAGAVVMDYHGKRCWGYDPVQHAEYEVLIANAIRDAVTAEQGRCVGVIEDELTVLSFQSRPTSIEQLVLREIICRIRGSFDGTYPVAAERTARIGEPEVRHDPATG